MVVDEYRVKLVPFTHRERLRPFVDDKTLDEVRKDVGFDHSLRGRGSPPLTADTMEHCQHWGRR